MLLLYDTAKAGKIVQQFREDHPQQPHIPNVSQSLTGNKITIKSCFN